MTNSDIGRREWCVHHDQGVAASVLVLKSNQAFIESQDQQASGLLFRFLKEAARVEGSEIPSLVPVRKLR